MVSLGTNMYVSDNSGAIKVTCIKILGNSFSNHSYVGDTLIVAVKSAKVKKKVSRKQVHPSILIRQKKQLYRKSGIYISFYQNHVVLIKPNRDPIGNRVIGCVFTELRYKKCLKIMLMASNLI